MRRSPNVLRWTFAFGLAALLLAGCGGSRHVSKSDRLPNLPDDSNQPAGANEFAFQLLELWK